MKLLTRLLMVLLLVCVVRVQAVYTISVTTSPEQTAIPGQSGQSYFDVSFNGGGTFSYSGRQLFVVDAEDPDHNPVGDSPFSHLARNASSTLILASGQTYNSGQTYRLVVDWTVAADWDVTDQFGIYFNLFAKDPDNQLINAGATDLVNINATSVPEPSQIMAGSVVLGCGLFLGVGRRLFTKPLV